MTSRDQPSLAPWVILAVLAGIALALIGCHMQGEARTVPVELNEPV